MSYVIEWNNQPVGNVWLKRRYTIQEIADIQLGKYTIKTKIHCTGVNHTYYRRFGGKCEDCKEIY